jgi:hypothetical protein
MATTQAADVSYISKVIYKDGIQQKQIVRDKPLLLATKHNTKFTSAEGIKVPILYGTGQGASATVANAATNASPDAGAAFTVTQATYYTNFDIHGKVVRNALKGNDDSFFLQQLKLAMDNAQETMGSELNRQAYGTSAGWRARVGAVAPSGTTAVLANPQDAVFFEPNMVVVFAATPTGAIRAGTPGWAKILKVDTQTGTLTFDGTITVLITTPGAGDYIFRQGDAQNGASSGLLCSGLADWNPQTVTATPFFGVDRTAFPSRLAGVRYNGSTDPLETVFIKAMAAAKAEVGMGFKKGDLFLNPINFAAVQSSKEGGRWITEPSSYGIGIDKFQIGAFKFVEDAMCPVNVAYMLAEGAYERASCGDAPYWNNFDGADMWLDRTTDQYKGQLVHDGNFIGVHTQQMMRIDLQAA